MQYAKNIPNNPAKAIGTDLEQAVLGALLIEANEMY